MHRPVLCFSRCFQPTESGWRKKREEGSVRRAACVTYCVACTGSREAAPRILERPRLHASRPRVDALDVAVKKCGELRFGKRADLGRLDVAALEQHQGGDAADAV